MSTFLKVTPAKRIVFLFALAIIIGTILLSLPLAAESGRVSAIDALFTATSAVCVTGLTVVNTGIVFSRFGEIVILILVQLGGLGLMVFSTLFFLALGGRISLGQRMTLSETFGADSGINSGTILRSVFILTFVMEALGTLILYIPFSSRMSAPEALYSALFHSVSAFCNAGFSIFSRGLSEYDQSVVTLLAMAFLIIIGGLGFSVVSELSGRLRKSGDRKPWSLQTKIVLTATGILLVGGGAAYFLLEKGNALSGYPLHLKIIHSFFQSATSRTAGFDPVNETSFSNLSLLLTVFLMIIGGSPGSTAGGIKTTSFMIIMAAIVSRLRGNPGVNIFRRTVGTETVIKAISIFVLAAMVIFAATMILMLVESNFVPHRIGKDTALDYFFETVSAFGTVGLSLGITSGLGAAGKAVLVLVMFTGRVGLLTMAYAIARMEGTDRIVYSEENVMIG
jgi:trk system potassium uptake protein TrkH